MKLVIAAERVVAAFERLGAASTVMDNLCSHRECEVALVELKYALKAAPISPNQDDVRRTEAPPMVNAIYRDEE